jgi:hypothetical protein
MRHAPTVRPVAAVEDRRRGPEIAAGAGRTSPEVAGA